MDWVFILKIAIPAMTAVLGAIIGGLVASMRSRARYEAKLREIEKRAVTAEAAAAALGKKVESLKSDIVEEVRDSLDASLFRFFTDMKTRIAQQNDLSGVRNIVERGFHATVQHVEQMKTMLANAVRTKSSTAGAKPAAPKEAPPQARPLRSPPPPERPVIRPQAMPVAGEAESQTTRTDPDSLLLQREGLPADPPKAAQPNDTVVDIDPKDAPGGNAS